MILTKNITSSIRKIFFWAFAYLLIAFSFVFFANDNTINELLTLPSFYTDVIFSISTTFIVGFYLNKLNIKFDLKYSWYNEFKTRLIKQFAYGVLLPLFLAMLAEIIYLKIINISIRESSIHNIELPLAFIFLILINITSFAYYLFKNKQKETLIIKEQVFENPTKSLEYINIQKGFVEEKLPIDKCALIMSSNKLLWLQTFNGEKYRLSGTLAEWEEKLNQSQFYRINRQYLSSFNAIKSIEQTETRKLKVNFVVSTDNVYISNSLNQMLTWKTPKEQDPAYFPISYGLGIFKIETDKGIAYNHSGDAVGYAASMLFFPDDSTTIVYAVNSNYGKIDQFVSSKEAMEKIINGAK